MKITKKSRKEKQFPRTYSVKMTDYMYAGVHRKFARQGNATIRALLISRYPDLDDKSSPTGAVTNANAPLLKATLMLGGCYASLREIQKHVCKCPNSALTLVRADLSEALAIIETRIGRACDLLAQNGENSP
jgi:hypothetical protein